MAACMRFWAAAGSLVRTAYGLNGMGCMIRALLASAEQCLDACRQIHCSGCKIYSSPADQRNMEAIRGCNNGGFERHASIGK